jgi:phosphohistidine phosphatase
MRIIFFRHGPAESRDDSRWPDDLKRPLTERGTARTRRSARGIARLEPATSQVLTSPATRALETARLLSAALHMDAEPELVKSLAPGGSWKETLVRLGREGSDAAVAIVGHEPDLGQLAAALLLSVEANALAFKKAGACAIDCDLPERGRGRLRWWLGPGALRALRTFRKGSVA